jgi:putative peptide zinc metalloprotease protein
MTEAVVPAGAESSLRSAPSRDVALPPLPPVRGAGVSDDSIVERVPVPAHGLEMLGRMTGSGHREAPYLVRRADGQMIQLTPTLYAALELIDGHRKYEEIAALLGNRIGKLVEPRAVVALSHYKLRPLGLIRGLDGSEPVAKRANPLLAIKMRFVLCGPATTSRIVLPFSKLFYPPIVAIFFLTFAASVGWLFFERGLGAAARDLLYDPVLVLLVFALTLFSAGFHELGHAAACRYGGAAPGSIGVGLYLIWPAFYTDVSDSYRLGRGGRLRVDLGGLYFNAIFAVAALGAWAVTSWEALLLIIPIQMAAMFRQLLPLVRLDGYHILADLTGVPDLFAHLKPILLSLLPWRRERSVAALRPWVRVVVTVWVLLVVPVLALLIIGMTVVFPRLAATAWDSMGLQLDGLLTEWDRGRLAASAARGLSIVAIGVPILSLAYLMVRMAKRTVLRVWRGTRGRPWMRTGAAIVAACMVAVLVTQWWPDGQYRPIQPDESGTIQMPFRFRPASVPDQGVTILGGYEVPASGYVSGAPLVSSEILPSEEARDGVIVHRDTAVDRSERPPADRPGVGDEEGEGFRFNLPDPAGEEDNQALAVNYKDGSSLFNVALSLIFDDDDVVDQRNEAWALASCTRCLTVAVAFQVILILDSANVVTPVNAAVAVNAYCTECTTFAIAMQLVVTLEKPLSPDGLRKLMMLWAELERLKANIEDIPLEGLYPILVAMQEEIIRILIEDGALVLPSDSSGTEGTGETDSVPSADPTSESTTDQSPTPSPDPSPTPSPEPSPTPSPEPSPSPSPSTAPSPEPTTSP